MNGPTDSPTFRELIADEHLLDEMGDLLSDRHRRAAIAVLADRDMEIGLTQLARAVARRIADESSEPSTEAVDELRLSLHHCHLPKLADAELIAYDTERRVIYPTDLSVATDVACSLESVV